MPRTAATTATNADAPRKTNCIPAAHYRPTTALLIHLPSRPSRPSRLHRQHRHRRHQHRLKRHPRRPCRPHRRRRPTRRHHRRLCQWTSARAMRSLAFNRTNPACLGASSRRRISGHLARPRVIHSSASTGRSARPHSTGGTAARAVAGGHAARARAQRCVTTRTVPAAPTFAAAPRAPVTSGHATPPFRLCLSTIATSRPNLRYRHGHPRRHRRPRRPPSKTCAATTIGSLASSLPCLWELCASLWSGVRRITRPSNRRL